jgi:hypothetical protein
VRSLRPGTYTITVRESVASPQFPPDGAYEYAEPLDHGGVRRNEDLAATPREGRYSYICDPHAMTMKGSFTVR